MTNAGGRNTDGCRAEFAARMVNGEEFERGGYIIKFDVSRLGGNLSPFVIIKDMVAISLEETWQCMDEWNLAPDWRDELSEENPRWCKAWNRNVGDAVFVRVNGYKKGDADPYRVSKIYRWPNAKPLDDELAARLDNAL